MIEVAVPAAVGPGPMSSTVSTVSNVVAAPAALGPGPMSSTVSMAAPATSGTGRLASAGGARRDRRRGAGLVLVSAPSPASTIVGAPAKAVAAPPIPAAADKKASAGGAGGAAAGVEEASPSAASRDAPPSGPVMDEARRARLGRASLPVAAGEAVTVSAVA